MKKLLLFIVGTIYLTSYAYDFQHGGIYYNVVGSNAVEVTYKDCWENQDAYSGDLYN